MLQNLVSIFDEILNKDSKKESSLFKIKGKSKF